MSNVSQAHLKWRCRRGMLELDILLNTFVEIEYNNLSKEDVDECKEFAEKVSGTMGYIEKRGQDSKSRKVYYDWLVGRLGRCEGTA